MRRPENEPGQDWLRLTLVFPPRLEDLVTDVLMANPALPGFTLLHAEGHGSNFARASVHELVLGRIEQRVLWMVIESQHADTLLAALRQKITAGEIRWWIEPVIAGGSL